MNLYNYNIKVNTKFNQENLTKADLFFIKLIQFLHDILAYRQMD